MLIVLGSLIGCALLRAPVLDGQRPRSATSPRSSRSSVAVDILRAAAGRAVRLCYGAVGIAIVLAAVQLATSGGNELRASGTFPNPNVAGNLLAIGLICWTGAPFRSSVKLPVFGVAILGVLVGGVVRIDDPARDRVRLPRRSATSTRRRS